jgi:hypothetical protein
VSAIFHPKVIIYWLQFFILLRMAGLFHDVGYFLIPKLKAEIDHKQHDQSTTFDDGHELLSLIATLWVYDKSKNNCKSCRRIIAVTILSTKINRWKFPNNPTGIAEIQKFLDPGVKDPNMFYDPTVHEQDKNDARMKTLVHCAWSIYFGESSGLEGEEICKPIVKLLKSFDVNAKVAYVPDGRPLKRDRISLAQKRRSKSLSMLVPRSNSDDNLALRNFDSEGSEEQNEHSEPILHSRKQAVSQADQDDTYELSDSSDNEFGTFGLGLGLGFQ